MTLNESFGTSPGRLKGFCTMVTLGVAPLDPGKFLYKLEMV